MTWGQWVALGPDGSNDAPERGVRVAKGREQRNLAMTQGRGEDSMRQFRGPGTTEARN